MEECLVKRWNRYEWIRTYSVLLFFAGIIGGIAAGFLWKSIPLGGTILVLGGVGCMLLESEMKKKKKKLLDEYLGDCFQTELTAALGNRMHTPEFALSQENLERLSWKMGEWERCQVEEEWESCYHDLHFSAANVQLLHLYQVKRDRAMETEKKTVFDGFCMFVETKNSECSHWTEKLKTAGISPAFMCWEEKKLFLAFDKNSADASSRLSDSYKRQSQSGCCSGIASCPCNVTKFAQIPEKIRVENIEDLKEAFRRSLQPVLDVLEILSENQ